MYKQFWHCSRAVALVPSEFLRASPPTAHHQARTVRSASSCHTVGRSISHGMLFLFLFQLSNRFKDANSQSMCMQTFTLSLFLSVSHSLKPIPCCWRACVCGHRPAAASCHWAIGAPQWIGRRVSYWVSRLGRLQARSRQCSQRLISNSLRIFKLARSSG